MIYLNFESKNKCLENEIQKDALEVLMKRHFIEKINNYTLIGDYWVTNIASDNLNRRCICCFGQRLNSYIESRVISKVLPYNKYQSEMKERDRVQREREKRWNLLDAGEWISFFKDVTSVLNQIGLVYFQEANDEIPKLNSLPQIKINIRDVNENTFLYLAAGTNLIIQSNKFEK